MPEHVAEFIYELIFQEGVRQEGQEEEARRQREDKCTRWSEEETEVMERESGVFLCRKVKEKEEDSKSLQRGSFGPLFFFTSVKGNY